MKAEDLESHGVELRELFEIVRGMIAQEGRPGTELTLLIAVLMQISMAVTDSAIILGDIADTLSDISRAQPVTGRLH